MSLSQGYEEYQVKNGAGQGTTALARQMSPYPFPEFVTRIRMMLERSHDVERSGRPYIHFIIGIILNINPNIISPDVEE